MFFLKYLALLLLINVAISVHAQTEERGRLVYIAPYEQDKMEGLFGTYQVPLLVISNHVYYPSIPCVDPRMVDGDMEGRNLSGNVEDRNVAGDLESRQLAGNTEDRHLDGDREGRLVQGDLEGRRVDGNTEDRGLGGDLEDRSLGGDMENRSIGGDNEDRIIDGAIENRGVDGDLEGRILGGDMAEIECYRLDDRIGFELKRLNQNATVLLYNNFELTEVRDFIVEY